MNQPRVFDVELAELKATILRMGCMVQGLINKAVEALKLRNAELAEQVIAEGDVIDQLELEIDEQCVQLIALRQPEASDLRFLMTAMRIATDVERIGDLTEDIAQRAIELSSQSLLKPLIDIPQMAELAQAAVAQVLEAFVSGDAIEAKAVWDKERAIDKLRDQVHEELLQIMIRDAKSVTRAIPLLLISRHLERIADHATNIAEEVVYMVEGKVVKHSGGAI